MSTSARILPNYTYEDYTRWEGRWELIHGIPYAMSPMPSPKHQATAGKLHSILLEAVDAGGCDCQVYQPIDYKIDEHTTINPDLMIVCKPIEGQYLDFAPDLVVEILSPSSVLKDRHMKYGIYEGQGIGYYVIVDPDKDEIEIYSLNEAQSYEQTASSSKLHLNEECTIKPRFEELFV